MTRSYEIVSQDKKRSAKLLAAFPLFAALLAVSRADASIPKTADVADLSRPALQLPAVVSTEPSRFGFAKGLALLNVEKELPRFSLFDGVETRRFERTYARNNPLTYVDPDGNAWALAPALAGGGLSLATAGGAALMIGTAWVAADIMQPDSKIFTWLANEIEGVRDDSSLSDAYRERIGDTGLENLSPEEVSRRARDKSLSAKERLRYIKQEKWLRLRNKQKRGNKQPNDSGLIVPFTSDRRQDQADGVPYFVQYLPSNFAVPIPSGTTEERACFNQGCAK